MKSAIFITEQDREDLTRAIDTTIVDIQTSVVFGKYAAQDGYTREDQRAASDLIDRLVDIYDRINPPKEA